MPRRIKIYCAPGISESERKTLESHFKEAMKDAAFLILTNYSVYHFDLTITDNANDPQFLLLNAPEVSVAELTALKKRIDNPKTKLIVVNHDLVAEYYSRSDEE